MHGDPRAGVSAWGIGHDPGQAVTGTAATTTTSARPVSPARRRRALLPPLLWAVSSGLPAARSAFGSDTFRNCR
ncbi:hypothetical protein ACIA6C_23395 [Streptomyces sp. NPDC051578]|uniref:hypothetical protein n=1 Tax=Streptomyces sp. NPDC051578 TaxID=3365662 RepID=UPI0037A4EC05